ncbi:MAG: DUF4843 domain-containing protein [Candidatus Pseudobacter hemicellulosilyticus]|uniref:DUF4843 domain-containing protein n=1 Tax=Candidatus Pseudobacter hemicellulosilyticus TaxID=3121375 RepID=A0AAJ5WMV6_9BACT|nr:MAG: DUF4843 domain-containing protein [Pseudobacter sp.]
MKNINYILIIVPLLILASCSKEELEVWSATNRVWFANEDTLKTASFKKFDPEVQEITVSIPVQMAGNTADQERPLTVEVLSDKRNPQTQYTIESMVVPADSARGVLKLKIKKTANLAEQTDTVSFVLRSSGLFETGLVNNLKCTVLITNKYIKPSWWYDYRCGVYSEAKHDVLFAVFDADNDIRGGGASTTSSTSGWTHVDALYNLWLLNEYCAANSLPFRFANGQ